MRAAISVPDDLFESGEALAKRLGLSRSRLYATALADFIAKHRGRSVTARLNAIYASEDNRLDKVTRTLQARSLPPDSW